MLPNLGALLAQRKQFVDRNAETTTGAGTNTADERSVLAALETKVNFYELMTGVRVEMAGEVAKCVVRCASSDEAEAGAPARTAAFELHLAPAEGDEGDIEYVPTDLTQCPTGKLPEYLRDTVSRHPATCIEYG